MKKSKIIHILIIVLGIIFISLPAFHTSLWFDESYSVAIAKHGFAEIWTITGNDVHPALYYWALHIVYLIFGNSILAFRLFSLVATIIVGILGYTHIRKDFGDKCGIFFSFLTFFLPAMTAHSQELRMYSWSFLIITLTAIYAYRFYKNIKEKEVKGKTKNLVLFGIFSICACYIHYYALITTCLINLILLIYLIRNRKEAKLDLRNFLILAGVQILLYIPWLAFLLGQIAHVHNGFWIEINPISTPVELLSFQFRRELDSNFVFDAHTIIALVSSVCLYIYLAFRTYKYKKEHTDMLPALLSFFVYVGIIGIMLLISLIIWRPVLFSRYLFVMTGLYIFWIAYMFSLEKNKVLMGIIFTVITILGTITNITNIDLFYEPGNVEVYDYLEENLQEGDMIVFSDVGVGGVVTSMFPEYRSVFLCDPTWNVDEAYKAYAPGMEIVHNLGDSHDWEFLKEYTGRICLVHAADMWIYEVLPKENIKIIKDKEQIYTKYHDYSYGVMILEKY